MDTIVSWASTRTVPKDRDELLNALVEDVSPVELAKKMETLISDQKITRGQALSWLVQNLDVVIGPPPLQLPLQPGMAILLETMLRVHPFQMKGSEGKPADEQLQSLLDLKSNHLSQTLPIVSTALLEGVLKSDAFLDCQGAAAGGLPRRWADLNLLDPYPTLELLLQVLTLYHPCFTYPMKALLATVREFYWYSVGSVLLHAVAVQDWSEDFVRSLFKMPDLETVALELAEQKRLKEEEQALRKASKKVRKEAAIAKAAAAEAAAANEANSSKKKSNKRTPLNPATLIAIVEISHILQNPSTKDALSAFLGVPTTLVLVPLYRLLTSAIAEDKKPRLSERALVTVQRLVEGNLKFQTIMRGDALCAGAALSAFPDTLYSKLGPAALCNTWADPSMVGHTAYLWQQFLARHYQLRCEARLEQQQLQGGQSSGNQQQRSGAGSVAVTGSDLNAPFCSSPEVSKVLSSYRPIVTPALWLKVFTEAVKVSKRTVANTATAAKGSAQQLLPLGSLMILRILTSSKVGPWSGTAAALTLQSHRPVIAAHLSLALQHLSQFVDWTSEPIGAIRIPGSNGKNQKASGDTKIAGTPSATIPSELYFELSKDIFRVLAQEQSGSHSTTTGFDIPLLPPFSAAYTSFLEKALTPLEFPKPTEKKGGGKSGKKGNETSSMAPPPADQMLPIHTRLVLQYLLTLFTATLIKKPKATHVTWWGNLIKKIASQSALLHNQRLQGDLVRLLAAACHHNVLPLTEVHVLAGSGAALRNALRQRHAVALALCRRVCTKVSADRKKSDGAATFTTLPIPMAWVEDLCGVLKDDTQPVQADVLVGLAAALSGGIETSGRREEKLRGLLAGLGRLLSLTAAGIAFPKTDRAAMLSLKLLAGMIQDAQMAKSEENEAQLAKQQALEQEQIQKVLAQEEKQARDHKATLALQRAQEERHRKFAAVRAARLTAVRQAQAARSAAEDEARQLRHQTNLEKEKLKIDLKSQHQDEQRRTKAQQFIWAEKNLAAHGDFLRSLEVPLHRVLETMTLLRKLHPSPIQLGMVSQQQVLELLVVKEARKAEEPQDMKPYVTPSDAVAAGEGQDGPEDEVGNNDAMAEENGDGMEEWFSDDHFDFWSAVEGEKDGAAATTTAGGDGTVEEDIEVDLREVAAKYSYHKRVAFLLDLFDFDSPEASAIPYLFLKQQLDSTARTFGWTNATHCFISLDARGLVSKQGTGPKATISLTALGWAYHANYADPTATYELHQLKVQEMIQMRTEDLELAAEQQRDQEDQNDENIVLGQEDEENMSDEEEEEEETAEDVYFLPDELW